MLATGAVFLGVILLGQLFRYMGHRRGRRAAAGRRAPDPPDGLAVAARPTSAPGSTSFAARRRAGRDRGRGRPVSRGDGDRRPHGQGRRPALLFRNPRARSTRSSSTSSGRRGGWRWPSAKSSTPSGQKLGDVLEMQPPQGIVEKVKGLGKLKRLADSMPKSVPSGRSRTSSSIPTSTSCRSSIAGPATRRAVHHAPRGDHEGPAHGGAQRRHVPDAEDRLADDLHALADPQGRRGRLARDGRPARRGGRARLRPGDDVLGERAASQAHRRVHARRLPPRRGRSSSSRRRPSTSRCRRTPRSCSRATSRRASSARGAVRRPHRLLLAVEPFPIFHLTCMTMQRDAIYPSIVVGVPPGGRLARQGDRADLPAGDQDDRPRDRRLRPAGRGRVPQLRHRLDPQGVPGSREKVMHAIWGSGCSRSRSRSSSWTSSSTCTTTSRSSSTSARTSIPARPRHLGRAARPARPRRVHVLLRRQARDRRDAQVGERGRPRVAGAHRHDQEVRDLVDGRWSEYGIAPPVKARTAEFPGLCGKRYVVDTARKFREE